MSDYGEFLRRKLYRVEPCGFGADPSGNGLYDWQEAIERWALRIGRAAIFADCGTGKTPMQLVWADRVARHTGRSVLILAPLAVAEQTVAEGRKFDIEVEYRRELV